MSVCKRTWTILGGVAALALTVTAASAAEAGPLLDIDSWWSGDFAKSGCDYAKQWMDEDTKKRINMWGCDAVTGCPNMMARYTACMSERDPKAAAFRFEDALLTQFSLNPMCKGATFIRYYSVPAKDASSNALRLNGRPWSLIIDYVVGGAEQSWTLQDFDHKIYHQADGATPAKIASDICAILMGHGGTIVR